MRHTVEIAKADEPIALRLLSALVLDWDSLPADIQVRLLREAALLRHGFPNATVLPAKLMAFVDSHKEHAIADPLAVAALEKLMEAP